MNITPKGAPAAPESTPSQPQSARERAISKLTSGQSPIPVNPNAVSAEELGSLRTQKNTSEPVEQSTAPEATESSPKEVEQPLSSQYAVLARKEKALRAKAQAQEQAIKQRELELQQREEAIKAKDAEYSSKYIPKDKLTNDTLNALTEAGLTYEQITQLMLNQPDPATQAQQEYQRKIEAKLAAIEEAQAKSQKDYQEQQSQQYQQAINQISLEAKDLVETNPDLYEAIQATGSVRDVVKLIERTFKEDGVLMSVEDAAAEVEEYLIEEATKLSRLKKIQRSLNSATKPAQEQPAQPKQQSQTMKTLTNSIGASGKLTARDRAILAFKNELKN